MVFTGEIHPKTKAYVKFLHEQRHLTVKEIVKKSGISKSTFYRCLKSDQKTRKKPPGRPRKINARDERLLERKLKSLRETQGNFSCQTLMTEAGLKDVSRSTVQRSLNRLGYKFLIGRKKGLLTHADRIARVKFARYVKKHHSSELWQRDICFYLDGVSFIHKFNPEDQARAPKGLVWRKKSEGLAYGCTTKGAHVGTGGRTVKMFVAISFGHGVIFCEQYDKLTGDFFAGFIRRNFKKLYRKSCKPHSRLFIQDNDPSQNSAKARKALQEVGAKLFVIPARSPDVNPIENVFHLVKRELERQALERNLTFETFSQFAERVKSTLYGMNHSVIDNIIRSMDKRMDLILKSKGNRTKY